MMVKSKRTLQIEHEIKNSMSKYEGMDVRIVIGKLAEEIQKIMYLHVYEGIYTSDFPLEFENELGKWRIESDGNTYVMPKTSAKHIEVNIEIKRTGDL